ncbi:MAG: hypothetical protein LBC73_10530 [Oscillospiraceae bacterium]|jgi:flagellar M-ring protein FliF|nr:hypothetical protein [Oscillospiraceae bacterium]
MRETIDRMMAQIREYLAKMPRKNKIQLAVVALLVISLASVMVYFLTRTNWVIVPNTGDPTTTSQIYMALYDMGIPVKAESGRVLVPEGRLEDAQMQLRNSGFLGTTFFEHEYLDAATGFGVTREFSARMFELDRAAQIRTQLVQNNRINNALVIVNIGETSPFRTQTNANPATVSAQLTLTGGGRLSQAEANAVGEIIKGGVPGLEYSNIHITDTEFNTYRVGDSSNDLDVIIDQRLQLQERIILQTRAAVEQLISPIFKMTNIRVQPYILLNFDKEITESITFEPPIAGETDGIVRSSEDVWENSRRRGDAEGIPGTDSNEMGAVEYPYGTLDDLDEYRRRVSGKNYELNETRRFIEHEQGTIREMSVGISINNAAEDLDIDESIIPQLIDLVSKGIGVSPSEISIQLVPFVEDTTFADAQAAWEAAEAAARTQWIISQVLMYGTIVLLGIMVMLMIRIIARTIRPPPEPEIALVAAGPDGVDYIIDDDTPEKMELEEIEVGGKSAGLEQIERFIDKDAASVAQLLRNWLTDA